jgi:hypothetical protein
MLTDVDADVFILVDGDDTYGASTAPEIVRHLLHEQLDFVDVPGFPSTSAPIGLAIASAIPRSPP